MKTMPAVSAPAVREAPLRSPWSTVVLAWLVPGLGHLLLGRRGRSAIIFTAVVISFAIGLLMRGPMFQPSGTGDILTRLIEVAGFVGDIAAGAIYFIAVGLGYWPPDQPTHAADYGSKFLVAAGLMNVLAMVDAYEIATREKE
jgi:uncharacterized protein DUF6677